MPAAPAMVRPVPTVVAGRPITRVKNSALMLNSTPLAREEVAVDQVRVRSTVTASFLPADRRLSERCSVLLHGRAVLAGRAGPLLGAVRDLAVARARAVPARVARSGAVPGA